MGVTRLTPPVDSAVNRHSHTSARSSPPACRRTSSPLLSDGTAPSVPAMAAAPSAKRNATAAYTAAAAAGAARRTPVLTRLGSRPPSTADAQA